MRTIPAFLSVDVEPDGFQLDRRDPPTWAGYAAAIECAERFRAGLLGRTGVAAKFGWYFRTDPQIAEIHGRPDHALAAFPGRADRLRAAGDYFGVHAHTLRWAPDRGLWVHEFADGDWQAYATRFALEAYGGWAGSPARLFRGGAGFLSNRIVEAADQAGVEADLTLEPVTGWGWTPRRCRRAWTPRPWSARTPTAEAPRGCRIGRRTTTSGSTAAGAVVGS